MIFPLLPGFISAGVFYTLTAHPKTTEFERLVQSLIFTSLIRLVSIFLKGFLLRLGHWWAIGVWDQDVEFEWSIALALLLGVIFAASANRDLFHRAFRWMGVSTRTSFLSEWYSAFSSENRYRLLHLKGGRRLRGRADEWPDQPDRGHFVIMEAQWIMDDDQIAPLYQVERFVLPAVEVEMVEFLKFPEEVTQDAEELERVAKLLHPKNPSPGDSIDGNEGTSTGA